MVGHSMAVTSGTSSSSDTGIRSVNVGWPVLTAVSPSSTLVATHSTSLMEGQPLRAHCRL